MWSGNVFFLIHLQSTPVELALSFTLATVRLSLAGHPWNASKESGSLDAKKTPECIRKVKVDERLAKSHPKRMTTLCELQVEEIQLCFTVCKHIIPIPGRAMLFRSALFCICTCQKAIWVQQNIWIYLNLGQNPTLWLTSWWWEWDCTKNIGHSISSQYLWIPSQLTWVKGFP